MRSLRSYEGIQFALMTANLLVDIVNESRSQRQRVLIVVREPSGWLGCKRGGFGRWEANRAVMMGAATIS